MKDPVVHPFTADSLRRSMPAEYKDIPIFIHDVLDSTNNRAKQLAMEAAPHGTVIMARRQTAGRGRLGRVFFSPPDGLYLSIIIRPDFAPEKSVLTTCAAAVAVAESIEAVCGQAAEIKWVNDIYVSGKKVCGILTEGITDFQTGHVEALVIGIGVNTSTEGFPPKLLNTAGAVEGSYSKAKLASSIICKTLELTKSIDDPNLMRLYKSKSFVIGKTVNVFRTFDQTGTGRELPRRPARVLDIDKDGALLVLYPDGTRARLTSGEISIRLES